MTSKPMNPIYLSTGLTAIATFLMGFIDAYTFSQHNGSFASAQTGNLVTLSAKLFSGDFKEAMSHVWVFAGFAIGAFIGEAVIERSKHKGLKKYMYYLLIQAILLFILAVFQGVFNGSVMLLILGLLAGYELTVLRKFRHTTINNGIMTGNTKNLMNNLYQALFNKDRDAKNDCYHLASIIIIFMLGAGAGTLIIQYNETLNLWVAFSIVLISFAWTTVSLKAKK
ncbi:MULTISPECIES: YoaK family protein [unclassified Sporosarcina]|uniref:YoaK family protein n=1 Tax=unclassified Sporosarcina TaxID=2647733 RepID=UPI0020402569|nr:MULTISPECIES: YoaK family protein [unclassified Sporosarcina]GKV64732.1 membrane protein [Sporosarcina sp. NCCP-2331]GLB54842.1 membrane protein [Sporosarcina sp. NCCP-2378]